jgi:DNA-binding XRE family transcriptional regulator
MRKEGKTMTTTAKEKAKLEGKIMAKLRALPYMESWALYRRNRTYYGSLPFGKCDHCHRDTHIYAFVDGKEVCSRCYAKLRKTEFKPLPPKTTFFYSDDRFVDYMNFKLAVDKALGEVSPLMRRIAHLLIKGYSYREIANELEVPLSTVAAKAKYLYRLIARFERYQNEDALRNRLVAQREALGLSRRAMARELGVKHHTLRLYELGEVLPPLNFWEKYESKLNELKDNK